jgi:hypothetical protein
MNVEDFLPGVGVAVDDNPVATGGNFQVLSNLGGNSENVPDRLLVPGFELIDGRDMLSRNQHNMLGCGRIDVQKTQTKFILVNKIGRNNTVTNLAEKTSAHSFLPEEKRVTQTRADGQHVSGCKIMMAIMLTLVWILTSACAGVTSPSDSDLKGIVKMYHHDLRWKYLKAAAARVDPAQSADFLEKLEDIEKDLNITHLEVRRIIMSKDENLATVRAKIRYYLIPSTVVKDEKIEQVWKKIGGGWFLFSQKGGPIETSEKEPEKPEETKPGEEEKPVDEKKSTENKKPEEE